MTTIKGRAYLICLLLIIVSGITQADYHYASHDGSNEYPYTSWDTAADSIQDAIDAAESYDTVILALVSGMSLYAWMRKTPV
ncbi:MAG: hypothetical protein J7K40_00710 [candidate division Zixibacteria bacterium]|nr:hypothetical protein [candidate division Zixibacteria bacterium]